MNLSTASRGEFVAHGGKKPEINYMEMHSAKG